MFLHLSVILFTRGDLLDTLWADTPHPGRHHPGQTPPGRHPPGQTPTLADTPRHTAPGQTTPPNKGRYLLGQTSASWQTPLGRHPPVQTPPMAKHPPMARHPLPGRHPHQEMAIAADGTHPTGMHSCFIHIMTERI